MTVRMVVGGLVAACLVVPAWGQGIAGPDVASQQEAQVLRYDAAYFAPQHPKTALDMIHWLPGFTFSAGDPTVRGFAAAAGNVLIDGERPTDKQFTLDQALQRIPANLVDHIEVIRGGAGGIDMLGQSVVANIVRRKSAPDSAAVTLADSAYVNGHNLPSLTIEGTHHGADKQVLTGAVSVSRYLGMGTGTGPQGRRTGASGNIIKSDFIHAASGGTTAFAFGALDMPFGGGQMKLNGSLAWTDFYNRVLDQSLFPAAGVSLLREHLGGPLGAQLTGEGGASYRYSFNQAWTSESQLLLHWKGQSYSSRLSGSGPDQLFDEHDRGGEAIGRTLLRYQAADLTAEAGWEGAYNWLGTTSSFLFGSFPVALPNAKADVTETRTEGSAKLLWSPRAWLQLDSGLRLEYSRIAAVADVRQAKSLVYPKPRLALTASLAKDDQLRLRAEREVGQLDFSNFVAASALDTGSVQAGNTDILPQDGWVLEAAYEHHFWNSGIASLTLRHSLISNAVDRVPIRNAGAAVAFDAPGNIGAGYQDAADIQLALPLQALGAGLSQIKASATLQRSSVTDPTTGQKRALSDMKPLEYSLEFRNDVPRLKLSWGASLVSSCWGATAIKDCSRSDYRFNEVDDYRVAPQADLFIEYQALASLSVRAEADNIAASGYNRKILSYAAPRSLVPLAYAEERRLTTSPYFRLSIRKAF